MNVRELKKMRASGEALWSSNVTNIFHAIAHNLGTSTIAGKLFREVDHESCPDERELIKTSSEHILQEIPSLFHIIGGRRH